MDLIDVTFVQPDREALVRGLLAILPEIPLARAVADTVYVMGKGRVVFSGTKDEFESREDIHEQHIGVG